MNKIQNKTTEVAKGISLNEKDYCTCLLSTLKDMEKNYTIAMTEASNEWLFDIYQNAFLQLAKFQRELFILMFQNGWYALENVESKKLKEKYTMLEDDYRSLSE